MKLTPPRLCLESFIKNMQSKIGEDAEIKSQKCLSKVHMNIKEYQDRIYSAFIDGSKETNGVLQGVEGWSNTHAEGHQYNL